MPLTFPLPNPLRPSSARFSNTQKHIAAFRMCHERYIDCLEYRSLQTGTPMTDLVESFLLDFDLAASRTLAGQGQLYRLFQLHFVDGHSSVECCDLLGLERFTCATEIRHIESTVGEALIRRGLFPLHDYFESGTRRTTRLAA